MMRSRGARLTMMRSRGARLTSILALGAKNHIRKVDVAHVCKEYNVHYKSMDFRGVHGAHTSFVKSENMPIPHYRDSTITLFT